MTRAASLKLPNPEVLIQGALDGVAVRSHVTIFITNNCTNFMIYITGQGKVLDLSTDCLWILVFLKALLITVVVCISKHTGRIGIDTSQLCKMHWSKAMTTTNII